MKDNFEYFWHYKNWHEDTEDSKHCDIAYAKSIFETHSIYPPPPHDNDKKDIRVLEIGCGMGRFLLHLRDMGYSKLIGIDRDYGQCSVAKKEGLEVFCEDALTFLEKDSTKYHAIYAFDVLEHVQKEKQLELLRVIWEHIEEEGMLVLQVPNALAPSASYYRYNDFTHTISFSEHSLGFLLHNANFHHFCIRPTHNESKEIQDLKLPWARIYRHEFGIDSIILTPNIMAVAFKSESALKTWEESAPQIINEYKEIEPKYKRRLKKYKNGIKKLYKKLYLFGNSCNHN